MDRVYVETTVVSYLTSRPSRDLIIAAHQQITREWWDERRQDHELCISQLVLREGGAGDPQAAQERLAILRSMILVDTTAEAISLAEALVAAAAVPAKVAEDALHMAVAAEQNIPFLITWNFRHMANATMRPRLKRFALPRASSARSSARRKNSGR